MTTFHTPPATPTELPTWDGDLTSLLQLDPLDELNFASRGNERNAGGEVFGGQYLGQALWAALATGGGRAPHAMSGYFLSNAQADRALHYRVERLRDGRSFAHRRVTASQDGRSVFCADVSLHDEEPTMPSHAAPMPQVSAPEGLATLDELLAQHGERMSRQGDERILLKRRVELRPVDAVSGIVQPGAEARSTVWLQALLAGPLAPLDHYAALAYLSDYWANASSRIVHGRVLFSGEISSASLNHAIWFHRRPDVSGPLLYALDSPSTHGGTGFNRGLIYQRDGRLIASTTQEALTRRLR